MNRMPVIAIVGRPNVGKSSLLNALVGKRISIVQDMPGVTRDRVSIPLRVGDRFVELVDTGGYGFVDPDELTEHIKHQIELAMSRADLVLFLVDCIDGRTTADEEIAGLLREKEIKSVLIANKADGPKADTMLADFARMGFGTPLGISALNNRNIDQVIDAIGREVDLSGAPTEVPPPQMMVAIVGKRNAGKSTLVNSIAEIYEGEGDRVIVSEVPGTTRDSIDVRFEKEGKTLIVIDTAGVRKKRHMMTNDIEYYSFHRAERSIRRADVVLMLIDSTQPLSEPDKKLGQYIAEQFKPVVLVVNKWDLAKSGAREQRDAGGKGKAVTDEELMEEYRAYLDAELKHMDFAPIAFITAKDGKNVQGLTDLCQHLFNQANFRLNTAKVNEAVRDILEERVPSTPYGKRARVYYATQTAVAPPTIVLFVNKPEFIETSYQRFMVNRLRELLPYPEVPIKLVVRARGGRTLPDGILEDAGEGAGPPRRQVGAMKKPGKGPSKAVGGRSARQQALKDRFKKAPANPQGPKKGHAKPHPKAATKRGAARGKRPGR